MFKIYAKHSNYLVVEMKIVSDSKDAVDAEEDEQMICPVCHSEMFHQYIEYLDDCYFEGVLCVCGYGYPSNTSLCQKHKAIHNINKQKE